MAHTTTPTITIEEQPRMVTDIERVTTPAMGSMTLPPSAPPVEAGPSQRKPRGRDRLLRGLHRIASSASLTRTGANGSSSTRRGYNGLGRGSMSCISLSTPLASDSLEPPLPLPPMTGHGHSYNNSYASNSSGGFSTAPTSPPGTPGEMKWLDSKKRMRLYSRSASKSRPQTPLTVPLPSQFHCGVFTQTPQGTTSCITEHMAEADYFSIPTGRQTRPDFDFWAQMPDELKIKIFSFLEPKEIVRASAVSKSWHSMCYDGQLWTSLDFSKIYESISAQALVKILTNAGPFARDLNLRGCLQMRDLWQAEGHKISDLCRNLQNFSLEGCKADRSTVHYFLLRNPRLIHVNLSGLSTINNSAMRILSQACPQLQHLDVSWCPQIDTKGIHIVVQQCKRLSDLRVSKTHGWNHEPLLLDLFERNSLERLVMAHCTDFDDAAFLTLMQGREPAIDPLTDRAIVPPRRFRHLDFTGCKQLTKKSLTAMHDAVPNLQGLCLHGCIALTDDALTPLFPSVPHLTHLDLEELAHLTNYTLTELAKASCAGSLRHLSLSYCEAIGDTGILPLIRAAPRLRNLEIDNTRISDLALHEAAAHVRSRNLAALVGNPTGKPRLGLRLVAYDCANVTWTGVRAVLALNAEFFRRDHHSQHGMTVVTKQPCYPKEIINLKCFYGFQPMVDEHTKRVLRGDLAKATMLERKWAEWMISTEEAGAQGAGGWRRRRRAREAERQVEGEGDGVGGLPGRRRARSGGCVMM